MQQISDHVRQQYMSMNVARAPFPAALQPQQFIYPTSRHQFSPAAAQACTYAAMPKRSGMLPSAAETPLERPEDSLGPSRHSTASQVHPVTQHLVAAAQMLPHAIPNPFSPQYPAAAQTQLNAAGMPSSSSAIGPASLSADAEHTSHVGQQRQSHQVQTGRILHSSPAVTSAHHVSAAILHSCGPADNISMQCWPHQLIQQGSSATAQLPQAHVPAPAALLSPSQPASPQHLAINQLHQTATRPDQSHTIAHGMTLCQPRLAQQSILQPMRSGQQAAWPETTPISQCVPSDNSGAQQLQHNSAVAPSMIQAGSNALSPKPTQCATSGGQGFSTLLQAVEQGDAADQQSGRVSAAQQAMISGCETPIHSSCTAGAAFAGVLPASASNPVINATPSMPLLPDATAGGHASPDHHAAQRLPTTYTPASLASALPLQTGRCAASSNNQQLGAVATSPMTRALSAAPGKCMGQATSTGAAVKPALPAPLADMLEASPVLAASDGSFRFAEMGSEGGKQSGMWSTPVLQARNSDTAVSSGERPKILTLTHC